MAPIDAKPLAADKELSVDETELYDRQIRLWGMDSQAKLRAANVLLVGMNGLGSEIAKNIILAGINSLTILESQPVCLNDVTTNFLLSNGSIGKKIAEAILPKAQVLNPLVKLVADTELLSAKSEEYFKDFTIIVATGLSLVQMLSLDDKCRKFNVQLICGDVIGTFGYVLLDLLDHQYVVDDISFEGIKQPHADGTKTFTHEKISVKAQCIEKYPSFYEVLRGVEHQVIEKGGEVKRRRNPLYYLFKLLLRFREKYGRAPSAEFKLDDLERLKELYSVILEIYKIPNQKLDENFLPLLFGRNACVCAILGAVIAQEAIRAVSHSDNPIKNMLFFDPINFGSKIEMIRCL